jgi:hypothetical protein
MNTSQLNSSSLGRIQDPTKNALNRKENPLGKQQKPENSATRTKQANKAKILSSLKDSKKTESSDKKFENASPQINDYMKMISRFENRVKQDEIEKEDLERVMQSLEDKILSMNEQQKLKLKNIDFFKKKGIENLKTMKASLIEMFDSDTERETFFEFLKSPEFVTVLLNEPKVFESYKPAAMGSNNSNSGALKDAGKGAEARKPPKV